MTTFTTATDDGKANHAGLANMGLMAPDLRAMRHADTVCFDYRDGIGQIRAIQRADRSTSGFDQTITIPVHAGIQGSAFRGDTRGYNNAYESILACKFSEEWQTILGILRTGDILTLRFWADAGTNELARDAGLHVDHLDLIVKRGSRKMTFHVSVRVSWDNSARMVTVR